MIASVVHYGEMIDVYDDRQPWIDALELKSVCCEEGV